MIQNKRNNQSKSAFNYTLLLDDVIENDLPDFETSSFALSSLDRSDDLEKKWGISDCLTLLPNPCSQDSELESPTKMSNCKNVKDERLRQSEGGLPWTRQKRNSQIQDFLTESSDCEENQVWDLQAGEGVGETRSDVAGKKVSNFSLLSCFKNNFSDLDGTLGIGEKSRSILKIGGMTLRKALKNRQYDNVIDKLKSVINNGKVRPS